MRLVDNSESRIFADFNNADSNGRVRLNTKGTLDELASLNIALREGMRVVLDDEEGTRAEATVHFCRTEGWVAEINWNAVEHYDCRQ